MSEFLLTGEARQGTENMIEKRKKEAEEQKKKEDAYFEELHQGPTVDILVGPEEFLYQLPRRLVAHFSKMMAAAFYGDWVESNTNRIYFREYSPADFGTIIRWIASNGKIMTASRNPKSLEIVDINFWLRVAQIADYLDLLDSHHNCIKQNIRLIHLDPENRDKIQNAHMKSTIELPCNHPLSLWFIDIAAFNYLQSRRGTGRDGTVCRFQESIDELGLHKEVLKALGRLVGNTSVNLACFVVDPIISSSYL